MENFHNGLKISIRNVLSSVSEETVNGIIQAIQNAGFKSLSHLQFVQEEHLMFILKPIPRQKLIKAWRKPNMIAELYERMKNEDVSWQDEFLAQARNSSESSRSPGILSPFSSASTVDHNAHRDSSTALRWPPNNARSSIPDLSMCTQRQASAGSSYMNFSHLSNRFSPYIDQTCHLSTLGPPPGVSRFTEDGPLPPEPPRGVSHFMDHDHLPHEPARGVSRFTDYGHLPPKAARGVSRFTDYDHLPPESVRGVSRFTDYDHLPPERVSSLASIGGETTVFAELSGNASVPSFKWPWKIRLVLLRAYTTYNKTELSSSNINEQSVWKKIAEEVRKYGHQCDAEQCRNQIRNMKCEYERMKHKKPYELEQLQTVFLDDAENAFEEIENPVVFSLQSNLQKWKMSNQDHIQLLKVYAKYKTELLLQNFDVEKQIIWEKFAQEVSNKCCSYYGKRRCCYEINYLKHEYEIFKKRNFEKSGKPYFFDEARKIFESIEHTGQHADVNFFKDFPVNQEKRDRWPPNNASSSIPDSSMFAQRLASARNNRMDTSEPLPNQFNPYVDQTYGLSPSGPPPGVSRFTDHGPLAAGPPPAVSRFTNHGPLAPRPPRGVSRFTDDDHWESGPLPGVSHFNEHNSLPSEQVSSLALIGGETTISSELSSNASLPSCDLPLKKRLALLRAYTIYNKTELSFSNINEQSVWKKIAEEVRKYGHQCDAEQCRNQIRNMKCEYERMKHKKPYESDLPQAVFLDDAENAFEEIENPVVFSVQSNLQKWKMSKQDRIQLLKVYAKYKTELLLQNFDVEKQIIWEKFAKEVSNKCCFYYGKRRCCYEINYLKHEYEICKTRNFEKRGKPYFFDEARKIFESIEHTGQHAEVNSFKDFSVNQEKRDSLPPNNANSTIPDLSMLAQRQAPAESSHVDHDPLSTGPPGISSLASIRGESIPPDQLHKLILKKPSRKRDKSSMLLNVYARYRTELSGSSVEENHKVWRKIADEFHERSNCLRCIKGEGSIRCTFVSGSECMKKIEELRLRYHTYKNINKLGRKMSKFFNTARTVFETTKDSGILSPFSSANTVVHEPLTANHNTHEESSAVKRWKPSTANSSISDLSMCAQRHSSEGSSQMDASQALPNHFSSSVDQTYGHSFPGPPVTTSAELSSNASLPSFKWNWKRRTVLLRLYTIYKRELSSSNINKQSIWKKIAKKVGEKSPCSLYAKQCRNQIRNIKSEYERKKHNKPTDQFSSFVLDEAENAFKTKNPYVFSLQSNLGKVYMSKPDRIKLLQVYTKYKTKLSLQNFDVQQQTIWGKVAREVSKRCSSFYGKRRCCYEINNLKVQYELFKKKKSETCSKPYFFKEARKAFESTQCTATDAHPAPGGVFPPPPNASNLMTPLPPPSSFQGPFVGVDDLPENATILAELSSNASLPSFEWRWKTALLRLYMIYKRELSSSNIDEQSMWKKIAAEVRKYGHECDAEQCQNQIHNMKCDYERMKYDKPYESEQLQTIFLDDAENAFEEIENPVVYSVQSNLQTWAMSKPDHIQLLKVYAKYKAELPLQNFDVEQQIVWGRVAREVSNTGCSYYGKRRCCYEIHNLKHLYEICKKKNLEKCGKPYFFDEARKTFESIDYRLSIEPSIEHTGILPDQLHKSIIKKPLRKREKSSMLLKVYARYRTELSGPSVEENHEVWKKIADEFHERSNCLRCIKGEGSIRCTFVSGSECMKKIEELRLRYYTQKNENKLNKKMSKFFKTARNVFETTKDSVTTFAKSSLPGFKWNWRKRVALLRAYTIYKIELSSSNIKEQDVWKKIADKVGKKYPVKCDAKDCHNQIHNMKFKYEEMKHKKPYVTCQLQSVFLDEAENAFEEIENPVVFSVQSNLEKWAMSESDHIQLLQVYSKYKEELPLKKFDAEQQIVWGRVAREVSEKCTLFCGKRWCCYEIHHLKRLYEIFKNMKKRKNKCKTPYYFEEARRTFESTECTGQHEVNSSENFTVNEETTGQHGVNSSENFIINEETKSQHGVNSFENLIIDEDKTGQHGVNSFENLIIDEETTGQDGVNSLENLIIDEETTGQHGVNFLENLIIDQETTGQHGVNSLENLIINEETTGQHGVNSLENLTINEETTSQHGVNSLDNFTVNEETKREEGERRDWYKPIDVV